MPCMSNNATTIQGDGARGLDRRGQNTLGQGAPQKRRHGRKFLPEVQALRALAVLAVVAWHFYPRAVPGGFVGVDVFFVISGFLITSKLLRDAEAHGKINLAEFWAARIRRIMPAATVTACAIIVATFIWWPTEQWEQVSRQGIASLLSIVNWVLAVDSVDYLASDNAPTAFQHYWSLSVEEQFYVLWPLVVILAVWLARRIGLTVRVYATVLFLAVILASFVWAEYRVRSSDPAAYFITTTRVWELALGGLIAALAPYILKDDSGNGKQRIGGGVSWRAVLALTGLAAMCWSILTYTHATPFPGVSAAVPVLGAAAVIIAGRTSGVLSLNWLVDWAPVQWLGKVSFSLYLWHWPVYMVFVQITEHKPYWWQVPVLMLISCVLAHVSWRWVEEPARQWKRLKVSPAPAWIAGAVATLVAVAVAVTPIVRADAINREQKELAAELLKGERPEFAAGSWDPVIKQSGAQKLDAGHPDSPGGRLVTEEERADELPAALTYGSVITPTPAEAEDDARTDQECFAGNGKTHTPRCVKGKEDGEKTIAVMGDSHARMLVEPLEELAKVHDWRIITYTKASCPMSLEPRELGKADERCVEPNKESIQRVIEDEPDVIITKNFAGSTFRGDAADGYERTFRELQKSGAQLVVVRDTPVPSRDDDIPIPRTCVSGNMDKPHECDFSVEQGLLDDPAVEAAERLDDVYFLDMTDYFCSKDECSVVAGNTLIYRDGNHVTNTYLRSLAPVLERRLPQQLRDHKD